MGVKGGDEDDGGRGKMHVMSDDTLIEWCAVPGYRPATWNPVRGCTKISPGCKHCYAEVFAERWRGIKGHPYEQGFDLRLVPEKLDEPLRKRDPRAYFVNSMSDLHQEGVPHAFLEKAYAVMNVASRHIFMVLTKRPENMRDTVAAFGRMPRDVVRIGDLHGRPGVGALPSVIGRLGGHVWLGTSVEDRKYGLPRVDVLREVPAAVRFLSIEPLLEDLGSIDLRGIHWVIVGGESGSLMRPCDPAWIESVVDQCIAQGVPVFVKQDSGQKPGRRGRLSDRLWALKQFPECVVGSPPCA